MVEFMVIAAPRSGTTWAANWLCTDTTHCLHDPLFKYHYSELDDIKSDKMLGISCTGLFMFESWLNRHPARKVILHRDKHEINESLCSIGLPTMDDRVFGALDRIKGVHVPWTDLFENPRNIYEFLVRKPFDKERHDELRLIEMQPEFSGLKIDANLTRRLADELKGA